MAAFLDVKDMSIAFEDQLVLDRVSFQVQEGDFVCLIGSSGAGKSTLLNGLAGLLPVEEGEVRVQGQTKAPDQVFSYMQQEDLLIPWLSLMDNVTLYQKVQSRAYKRDHPIDQRKLLDLIQLFGLQGYEYALPSELSGGMRQRTAFLRTCMDPAPIMLLDEPFASIDAATRASLQDWLLGIRSQLDKTILMVTHDLDEAIYLADRILILGDQPAHILREVRPEMPQGGRDRTWLYQQGELKADLHNFIRQHSR